MLGKDKEERRLKKAKISLIREPKFALWSGILMVGSTSVVEDIPSACTDGKNEQYGREFVKSLNDKELAFVVLHENLHKAFRHLFIWRTLWEQDAQLANMACDYVINLMLVKMDSSGQFISMPMKDGKPHGLLDPQYDGMNAKQVFELLKQDKQNGTGAFSDGDGEGGGGFDDHDWQNAKELTDEQKQELEKEIDRALRQGQIAAKRAGTGSVGQYRELVDLLEPEVNWREVLRDYVKAIAHAKDASSWRRVNRRFIGGGVYMPTMVGESLERIAIGIDTSASIRDEEIAKFLAEVESIAGEVHPQIVDLMYWDTSVAAHETYEFTNVTNIVSSTKPRGGGGTDPSCVPKYLTDKKLEPQCVVMLTDGEIWNDGWGNWDVPVLWVITGTKHVAPVGQTINVKEVA